MCSDGAAVQLRRLTLICIAVTAAIASLGVLAWLLDLPVMARISPQFIPVAPATALLFLVLGLSLLAHEYGTGRPVFRRASLIGASLVFLTSSVILVQFLLGLSLDVERVLSNSFVEPGIGVVNRMSPVTAVCVLLSCSTLLILGLAPSQKAKSAAAIASFIVTAGGLVFINSYFLGVMPLYGSGIIPVSLMTSLAIVSLNLGLFAASGPHAWPTRMIIGPSVRARLLRAFMPMLVITVLIYGWMDEVIFAKFENPLVTSLFSTAVSLLVMAAVIYRICVMIGGDIDRVNKERDEAREALSASEATLRSIYESSPMLIGIVELTEDDSIVHIYDNSATARFFRVEYTKDRTAAELGAPPEAIREWVANYRQSQQQNKPVRFEYVHPAPNGPLWISATVSLIGIGKNGRPRFSYVAENITDRKRAESITHARLGMLSLGAATMSRDVTLQLMLDEIEKQTGSTIGFYHFLDPDQETLSLQAWSTNTLRNGCTAEGKGRHYNVSQAGVWMDCVRERRQVVHNDYPSLVHRRGFPPGHAPVKRIIVTPILRDGRIAAIIGVGNKPADYNETDVDIAQSLGQLSWEIFERKRAVEELEAAHAEVERRRRELAAANKELEAFSYSVSHDLRAPLRRIEDFIRAVLEDYSEKLDDTGKDYLRRISGGARRMKDLIDALLRLSRYARADVNRSRVNLSALVQAAAAERRLNWPERRVELVIAEGITADGDPAMLEAAITNLVGNAWKFTQNTPDAKIEFGVTEFAGKTVYYVRDNGAGFDKTSGDRLFTPFQRLHADNEFPGLGIGLSIVQRIIHRHGGRIWAEGEVDKGATFYFTLG